MIGTLSRALGALVTPGVITAAFKSREGQIFWGGAVLTLLINVLLLLSTVDTYRLQSKRRAAAVAAAQDERGAGGILRELITAQPNDADVRVLLGCYEYDRADLNPQRLDTAQKLFEDALVLQPGRTSAVVGLVATRLRLAEGKPVEARVADVTSAEKELERATDKSHPDIKFLEGAAALLRGQAERAVTLLEDAAPDRRVASGEGAGARAWNLAAAQILARQGDCYQAAALGYMLRRWPIPAEYKEDPAEEPGSRGDAEKLLVQAYRVALAEPTAQPNDAEALGQRATEAARLVGLTFSRSPVFKVGQAGRFLPHVSSLPEVRNAVGLAFYRAERYAEAAEQFSVATRLTKSREPLYLLNHAQAAYHAGLACEETSEDRRKHWRKATDQYKRVCDLLKKQEGRESTLGLAMTNAAAIFVLQGKPNLGRDMMTRMRQHHPNEAALSRDLGALEDHCNRGRAAIQYYSKAIELQHPDSALMQRRILYYESR